MTVIRHVCAGHEYRFDTITGQVRNNYGTVRSVVKRTSPSVAHLFPARIDGAADTDNVVATIRSSAPISDAQLAEFAIGHTAANFTER